MRSSILTDRRVDDAALDAATLDSATRGSKVRSPVPVAETFPRKGPWSGNNQLGVELPFTASPEHPQTLLKLDEWGLPEVWTISLGYRLDVDIPAGQAFDALAEIEFGSGGITQQLVCDWEVGTVLSLPMNAVNVRARWNPAAQNLPFPEGVRISVQLARGAACAGSRATRSLPVVAEAGKTSVVQPLPAFARSVRIIPGSAADNPLVYASTFSFDFSANVSGVSGDGSVTGDHLGPDTAIRIPPFARYFSVTNTAGSALACIPIFSLVAP